MLARTDPDSVKPLELTALIYGRTVVAALAALAAVIVHPVGFDAQVEEPNVTAQEVVATAPIVIFPLWSVPEIVPFVPVPHAPEAIDGVVLVA